MSPHKKLTEAMTTAFRSGRAVTVIFRDAESVERAYFWLRHLGYSMDEINLLMADETRTKYFADDAADSEFGDMAMGGAGVGSAADGAGGAVVAAIAASGTSVVLPGIGLVVAGPMAAALAGAGAGAGGLTGGLVGALIGSGIPEKRAREYETGIKEGALLVSVSFRSDEEADDFERILSGGRPLPPEPQMASPVGAEIPPASGSIEKSHGLKSVDITEGPPARGADNGAVSLYANSWFEDRRGEPLPRPVSLLLGEDYKFLFAIERGAREQGATSRPFQEPATLRTSPETKILLEVCSTLLGDGGRGGYVRREVVYRRGAGFAPETFGLKPTKVGTSVITVRLIKATETLYRESVEVAVIAARPTELTDASGTITLSDDDRHSRVSASRR